MRCIGAFMDNGELVLYTAEQVHGLPQPREAIDLNSILAWSVSKHTTDYSDNHKPGQVYQTISISLLNGRVHQYSIRVGHWIRNNAEIELDNGLIEEVMDMLTRRFA